MQEHAVYLDRLVPRLDVHIETVAERWWVVVRVNWNVVAKRELQNTPLKIGEPHGSLFDCRALAGKWRPPRSPPNQPCFEDSSIDINMRGKCRGRVDCDTVWIGIRLTDSFFNLEHFDLLFTYVHSNVYTSEKLIFWKTNFLNTWRQRSATI